MQYENNRARSDLSKSSNTTGTTYDICVATETRDVTRTINGEEYAEVLLCNSDNIRMERILSKAPLLFNHDWNDHLGVIESVYVKDNTFRAVIRFSEIGRAGEMLAKVREGTLNCISVGYSVQEYRIDQTTKTMFVTSWEPTEISVVTVPADINAGIHRSKEDQMNMEVRKEDSDDESHLDEAVKAVEEAAAAEGETPAEEAEEVKEAIEAKRSEEEEPKEGESSDEEKPETKTEERKEADSEEEKTNVNTDAKEGETKTRKLQMSFNIDSMNTVNKEEVRAAEAFDLMGAIRAKADGKSLSGAAAEFEQEALRKGERLKSDTALILPADALMRSHATQAISGTPVGTATVNNGQAVVNQSYRPDMFLTALRERSVLGQLGIGSIAVDNGVTKFPRETQQNIDLNGFIAEDVAGPNQDYRFELQTISPKTFAARSAITRSLMQQSNGSILSYVQDLLMKDAALALEKAVLRSVASATAPAGIIPSTSAATEVKTGNATAWTAEVWATIEGALRGKKVYGNLTAICSPAVLAELKNVMIGTATGRYLAENGKLRDLFPVVASGFLNDVTDKVYVGDYSNTKLIQFGALQLDVDTTTFRTTGGVGLNLFADLDIAHMYPEAYAYAIKKV